MYYLVRKILGFSRAEWDDLPWHDQRMYVEELQSDPEYNDDESADSSGGPEYEVTDLSELD